MASNPPTILVLLGWYVPGFRAGGPIRTLASIVERLGDEFEFKIVTRDRDHDGREPYPDIRVNEWQRVGKAQVLYLSPDRASPASIRRVVNDTPHDVLYLNSFFSPRFSVTPMLLRMFRLIDPRPVIMAPRGELSIDAVKLKAPRKRLFLAAARLVRLYRGVVWQASSGFEEADIRSTIGRGAGSSPEVVVAGDLAAPPSAAVSRAARQKQPGRLRAVFLSRIAPMKNLEGALRMLAGVRGEVTLDVYGPLQDPEYWSRCQAVIASLPANVRVEYRGEARHDQVGEIFAAHDLFLFPTLGENFGHVIVEALSAGCPILISDRTPWRELEPSGAGWDLPLEHPERFTEVIQRCVQMDGEALEAMSRCARALGVARSADEASIAQNRELFRAAAARPR